MVLCCAVGAAVPYGHLRSQLLVWSSNFGTGVDVKSLSIRRSLGCVPFESVVKVPVSDIMKSVPKKVFAVELNRYTGDTFDC
jgi:hypothetical protein